MASEATYRVQVAWSTVPTNAFTLGTSTLGGGDVLVGQFSDGGFLGAYNDITLDVKTVRTSRGRDDRMDQMRAGTATIALKDLTGAYNPKNPASPLVGQLTPMRPLRVQATHLGTTRTIFYGFIRTVEANPNDFEVVIEATDLFLWLSRVTPTIAATGPTTTGSAIGLVLDAANWSDPSMRALDTGDVIPDFSADGSKTALAIVAELLEAERGTFFVADNGVVTYQDRHHRDTATVSAAFSGTMTDVRPGVDLDRIRNRATVERTGGTAQTASDPDSIASYGLADTGTITTPYLADDNQAASLASYIVNILKNPAAPTRGMTLFNENVTLMTQILDRDIGDRITYTEPKGDTAGDCFIERIDHEITHGGKVHRVTWGLSDRSATGNPFTLGSSTLGGGDVLTY